jgi:hypothetical protein
MARKINLNSPEIYLKLGTPSMTPRSTTAPFFTRQDHRRSISQDSTPHVQSPDFSKQLPRTELKQFATDVHEKRFVAFQAFPTVSSRVPRIPAPDLSRTTGRDFVNHYSSKQDHKDYAPNYKAVWKGSGKQLLSFEAVLPRKPLYQPNAHDFGARDVKYSQVDPNIAIPNIEKTTSRPSERNVPMFMVNVHYLDRVTGHVVPNFKSLKMNNYMNTNFLPLTSSFGEIDWSVKSKSPGKGRRYHSPNKSDNNY